MSNLKEIRQDRLKIHFLKPEGEISRRELLKLVLPRHEVVPFIEATLCQGYRQCGLCVDVCPLKAIKVEEGEVAIDTAKCSGCGACVEPCPRRAVVYPTFSLAEMDKEMESWLLLKEATLEPRLIAAVCQRCLPQGAVQVDYPGSVLPLRVPCLAMASPWLILRAFDRGAQGFALISGRECRSGFDSVRWRESVRFVQGLFGCWGIETERIRIFEFANDESDSVGSILSEFAEQIVKLGPTPLGMSPPALVPDEGLRLPALLKGMIDKLEGSSGDSVLSGIVPFGMLELEGSKCTGCGLCAADCPTGALTVSSSGGTEAYQLLFRHEACVACSRCVGVCPEECLRLERVLELDKLDAPATVLFEDVMVRCSECGSLVGSRAMLDNIRDKMIAAGQFSPDRFELCPACKIGVPFSRPRK